MALIQEMAVKVDQDFLAAMLALFTPVTDIRAHRQKVGERPADVLGSLSGPGLQTSCVCVSVAALEQRPAAAAG